MDYDLNYIKGYSKYKNINVFIFGYLKGLNSLVESWIIRDINNEEFEHDKKLKGVILALQLSYLIH